MNLLKILRKICCHRCHEDHWGLDQDETKIKISAQLLQAFDALTPEDKLKVLIEIMVSCEKLKATTGLDSYFLEEQEVRLLKESIKMTSSTNTINDHNSRHCLTCNLIGMGSAITYSDGSCPQCGEFPS
eukprot:02134.XXX_5993_5546_1 [CDS] Oithona nana genome sequencing.